MKRVLILFSVLCLWLTSFSEFRQQPPAWDKPLKYHSKKAFENVTIDWYIPEYYYADYWYSGQPAGYFFFLALIGSHESTWELSIDIETTIGGVTSMKTFVFTVAPCGPYTNHSHVLEMISQMAPGETIPWDADMTINHWWIVS